MVGKQVDAPLAHPVKMPLCNGGRRGVEVAPLRRRMVREQQAVVRILRVERRKDLVRGKGRREHPANLICVMALLSDDRKYIGALLRPEALFELFINL